MFRMCRATAGHAVCVPAVHFRLPNFGYSLKATLVINMKSTTVIGIDVTLKQPAIFVMKRIITKHPLAIRWFHWINFPVLAIMIWSGLLIYWANDVYAIKIGGRQLIKFFPKSFYEALHVPFHLAEGMAYHFLFMWLFFINGLLYVLYTIYILYLISSVSYCYCIYSYCILQVLYSLVI